VCVCVCVCVWAHARALYILKLSWHKIFLTLKKKKSINRVCICLDGLSLLISHLRESLCTCGACARFALIIDWNPSPFLSVHPRHRKIGKATSTRLTTDSFLPYAQSRVRNLRKDFDFELYVACTLKVPS